MIVNSMKNAVKIANNCSSIVVLQLKFADVWNGQSFFLTAEHHLCNVEY